ncbi:Uncharacterized protein FWK35_00015136 [Aphis craccivora]|uniref:Uncharacterized protein n=1 Tax=Aphis craccivora TaxID=307492 RepID=A0A6G0Z1S2_APHCR|nr:Uncharacterized protein FWK35_00015136 [Aphis craccivora]
MWNEHGRRVINRKKKFKLSEKWIRISFNKPGSLMLQGDIHKHFRMFKQEVKIYFKAKKTNKEDKDVQSNEDRILKSRVVLGIQNKGVQERLLREDLSLEKTLQYYRGVEAAEQNRKEREQSIEENRNNESNTNDQNKNIKHIGGKPYKTENTQTEFNCKRCATTHGSRSCPAYAFIDLSFPLLRYGLVARIPGFHPGGSGSIPVEDCSSVGLPKRFFDVTVVVKDASFVVVGCSSSLKKKIMGEMCMANFTSNGDNILVDIVMGCVYRGSQFLSLYVNDFIAVDSADDIAWFDNRSTSSLPLIPLCERTHINSMTFSLIRYGLVARIPGFHPGGSGSIPANTAAEACKLRLFDSPTGSARCPLTNINNEDDDDTWL